MADNHVCTVTRCPFLVFLSTCMSGLARTLLFPSMSPLIGHPSRLSC